MNNIAVLGVLCNLEMEWKMDEATYLCLVKRIVG